MDVLEFAPEREEASGDQSYVDDREKAGLIC